MLFLCTNTLIFPFIYYIINLLHHFQQIFVLVISPMEITYKWSSLVDAKSFFSIKPGGDLMYKFNVWGSAFWRLWKLTGLNSFPKFNIQCTTDSFCYLFYYRHAQKCRLNITTNVILYKHISILELISNQNTCTLFKKMLTFFSQIFDDQFGN